ncbi:MAG: DUF4293 domain-containing protein [Bacteroidales bacterium]|nr:DUF4293 domain-containing protein [Bacteroidales bacterium]
MIQRIQTLWFLLASATAVLIYFFPVIELTHENALYVYDYDSISIAGMDNLIQSGYIVAGLLGVIAFLSFIAIFFFKNRILQMRICTLISLLIIFLVGLISYFSLSSGNNIAATIGLSAVLPIIIFIFILMARRAVKKDYKLVRSVDRIR